jgi:hypothetical protein
VLSELRASQWGLRTVPTLARVSARGLVLYLSQQRHHDAFAYLEGSVVVEGEKMVVCVCVCVCVCVDKMMGELVSRLDEWTTENETQLSPCASSRAAVALQ